MTFRYAASWKRLIAYLIDITLVNIISIIIYYIAGVPLSMFNWLIFYVFMIYSILMDYKFQGTVGKLILKLKVIRVNGERPDLSTSFYRNFGKVVSTLPLLWGFIRILTPSYPQSIHDEISRCLVVER